MRKKFCNPYQKRTSKGFSHFLMWQLGYYRDPLPRPDMPADFVYPNEEEVDKVGTAKVRWINHSTYWVEVAGKRFLLDPIWSHRCSPLPFVGPRRYQPPSHKLEELGPIDYVILSHNHYDHLDLPTLRRVIHHYPQVRWVVPSGVKAWLLRRLPRCHQVLELGWWEGFEQEGLAFTAVPAQHFSGRGLLDRNSTLWMGCVVQAITEKKRFYFAGDTGYNPYDFKAIGARFGHMDLSLLPIGVYTPRRFMEAVHVSPEEAVQIHKEVGSRLSVGGHWGTFRLSSDSLTRAPYDLFCALQAQGESWQRFRILTPGQLLTW